MQEFDIEPFLYANGSKQCINTKTLSELILARPIELFRPHKTLFYVIHLFEEGQGKHSVDFNTFNVEEKSILFLSQNQINQFHQPLDYKGRVLIFTQNFFCKSNQHTHFFWTSALFNDPLGLPYFNIKERYDEVASLFNFISKELERPYSEIQSSILNNYLFNILLIAEEIYKPQEATLSLHNNRMLVYRFKSLVNSNLTSKHSLKYYAEKLNVNLRTLQKAFQEIEGSTPKKWITDRLILEIKRNLAYKESSISIIAFQLGFNEISNFTTFFKTHTGITPKQFRNSIQNTFAF